MLSCVEHEKRFVTLGSECTMQMLMSRKNFSPGEAKDSGTKIFVLGSIPYS